LGGGYLTVLEKILNEIEDYGKYKGILKLEENGCNNWVPVREIKKLSVLIWQKNV
jgi:hypothetical protein